MTPPTETENGLPLDMVIFGGMGDLDDLAHVGEHSRSFISAANFSAKTWDGFLKLLEYVRLDVQAAPDFGALAQASRAGAQRVFYLSTAPTLFTTICDKLAAAGLVDAHSRVVLEKPLGHDLPSAIEINEAVNKVYISTFGRGIWETSLSGIEALAADNGPTALKESLSSLKVRLYPTVNEGAFVIETSNAEKSVSVSIIDVLGREVHVRPQIRQKEFFRLDLLPGTYYVRVTDENRMTVLKMVVD